MTIKNNGQRRGFTAIAVRFITSISLIFALAHSYIARSQHTESSSILGKETHLNYGFHVKEGVNWFFSQVESNDKITLTGHRYHPSFAAYVELGNYYDFDNGFFGTGTELQYSWRGGKLVSEYLKCPVYLYLDYLDWRLYYVGRSVNDKFIGKFGVELSFLQNATYESENSAFHEIDEWVASKNLGIWFEVGSYIGKHITWSVYLDWLLWGIGTDNNDILKEKFWGVPTDDHDLNIGITLGWIFSPVKLGSKK